VRPPSNPVKVLHGTQLRLPRVDVDPLFVLAGVALLLVGVAMVFVPAALILAGLVLAGAGVGGMRS